jgi:hypothetical protein
MSLLQTLKLDHKVRRAKENPANPTILQKAKLASLVEMK